MKIETFNRLEPNMRRMLYRMEGVNMRLTGFPFPVSSWEWKEIIEDLKEITKQAEEVCESCKAIES